jgi:phospholipid/cholesterol/gamma-HCH transport system substrate-binding protein
VQAESTLYKFNSILTNLDEATRTTSVYLKTNQAKIDEMTTNFLGASRQLSQLLARNAPAIDSSIKRFDRISAGAETLVNRLDTVASTARRLADAIENHEGTIQLLLEDRRLYDDLRQTADNIDDLINDIRTNPHKYISLKVQLF